MSFGVVVGGAPDELRELAAAAEDRGLASIWVEETSRESTLQAMNALGATTSIEVGTCVTLAFPRSPTITAMQAWDLDEYGHGRFTLGLGSQVRRIVEERFSAPFDHPACRMEEYVAAMRAAWAFERGLDRPFVGSFYSVTRPGIHGMGTSSERREPPVHIAAVGPRMTSVAARCSDGILAHPFTSLAYLRTHTVPRIEGELADNGRDRADFRLCQGVITSISDDRARARADARLQIAFYGSTPNYRRVLEVSGDEELADRIRRTWRRTQDADALIDAVPDDAVDRYAAAGTPDEVRERLSTWAAEADHVILGGPWFGVDARRVRENRWAMIEALASVQA